MTNAESANYKAKFQSRQCTKSLKESLERKHAHPQDVLNQKMVTSFWKKKKYHTDEGST